MDSSLTSDQVNYVVWRYLQESGFLEATIAFEKDSNAHKLETRFGPHIELGALIHLIQQGLQWDFIEKTLDRKTGKQIPNAETYSFFGSNDSQANREEELVDDATKPVSTTETLEKQDVPMRSPSPEPAINNNSEPMQVDDKFPLSPEPNSTTPTKRTSEELLTNGTSKAVANSNNQKPKRARLSTDLEETTNTAVDNIVTEPDTTSEEVRVTVGESVATQVDYAFIGHDSEHVTQLSSDDLLEPAATAHLCSFNPMQEQLLATSFENCHFFTLHENRDDSSLTYEVNGLYHRLGDEITSMVWSDEGDYLVTGSFRGIIRLWESKGGGRQKWVFNGHRAPVMALKFDPKQQLLLSVDGHKNIALWDLESGRMIKTLSLTKNKSPMDAEWISDANFVVVGSDGAVEGFEPGQKSEASATRYEGHDADVTVVRYNSNVELLATAGDDHKIILWKIRQSSPEAVLEAHTGSINHMAWSSMPDKTSEGKSVLASCSDDGTVKIWDPIQRSCLYTMGLHRSPVQTFSISPNGLFIASGGADSVVMIWHMRGGDLVGLYDSSKQVLEDTEIPRETQGQVEDLSWDKDGKHLAVAVDSQKCVIINWSKIYLSTPGGLYSS